MHQIFIDYHVQYEEKMFIKYNPVRLQFKISTCFHKPNSYWLKYYMRAYYNHQVRNKL